MVVSMKKRLHWVILSQLLLASLPLAAEGWKIPYLPDRLLLETEQPEELRAYFLNKDRLEIFVSRDGGLDFTPEVVEWTGAPPQALSDLIVKKLPSGPRLLVLTGQSGGRPDVFLLRETWGRWVQDSRFTLYAATAGEEALIGFEIHPRHEGFEARILRRQSVVSLDFSLASGILHTAALDLGMQAQNWVPLDVQRWSVWGEQGSNPVAVSLVWDEGHLVQTSRRSLPWVPEQLGSAPVAHYQRGTEAWLPEGEASRPLSFPFSMPWGHWAAFGLPASLGRVQNGRLELAFTPAWGQSPWQVRQSSFGDRWTLLGTAPHRHYAPSILYAGLKTPSAWELYRVQPSLAGEDAFVKLVTLEAAPEEARLYELEGSLRLETWAWSEDGPQARPQYRQWQQLDGVWTASETPPLSSWSAEHWGLKLAEGQWFLVPEPRPHAQLTVVNP